MGSLRNNSKAPYYDQQDVKTAWAAYLRGLKTSGLSVLKYCAQHTLIVDEGVEWKVKPHHVYYARKHVDPSGGYFDHRHVNPGRPVTLSGYCQSLLFENFINFPNWSAKAHYEIILDCIDRDPRIDQTMTALARKLSYPQAKRFLKSIHPLVKTYANGGLKDVQEKFGPCSLKPNYLPGQLLVADTVTLKDLVFMVDGKPKSPQVTFLMDAASGYCVWAVLHWDNATAEVFLALLQQGLAREFCPKKSDLWIPVGCPAMLLTDNGPIFKNKDVARFCHDLDIQKEFSVPYRPTNNGQAESFSKVVSRGFSPHLVQLAIREGLVGNTGASERRKMFVENFYKLIERYNQTLKKHLGMTPIQYFEQNRPHQALNPHSADEILQASRCYTHVTVSKTLFTYNGETYSCKELGHTTGRFKIWYDPCDLQPVHVTVEKNGKTIGTASSQRIDASALTSRPTHSRGVQFITPGVSKFPKRVGKRAASRAAEPKVEVTTINTAPQVTETSKAVPALVLKLTIPAWAKGAN